MLVDAHHNSRGNLVLSSLSQQDYERFQPFLEPGDFKVGQTLENANRRIEKIFFPYTGLLAVLVSSCNRRHEAEAGIIGWEGMTGWPIIVGGENIPMTTIVQADGHGRYMSAEHLKALLDETPSIRASLFKFLQAFLVQIASNSLASSIGTVDQRIARWLLMAHDRTRGNDLPVTHEFLALMLGTRRASVTIGLHHLEADGAVSTKRGLITIVDREKLTERCDGLYGNAERELARLFPNFTDFAA